MLWNEIYGFFTKYVFGGYWQGDFYETYISGYSSSLEDDTDILLNDFVAIDKSSEGFLLSLNNYFSLIATIITMVAILLFCVFIVKKIIGIIFRLFTGSSAF